MNMYRFKVSIVGMARLHRIMEASGNCTFDDVHDAIFQAFDRYDPHLYSFYMTKKEMKNTHSISRCPEITHPANLGHDVSFEQGAKSTKNTRIDDVDLEEKDIFYYLFDFGDEWWHRIRVESITEADSSRKKILHVVKSVGDSPPQYLAHDEEEY